MATTSICEYPWISIESLFEVRGNGRQASYAVRLEVKTWPGLAWALNSGKGIYLLSTLSPQSRAGSIGYADIIYIGEAGGIGPNSNFRDRIGKHFLKANRHHNRAGGPMGITISERWLNYVDRFEESATRRMYVRLLQMPGETVEQRHRIGELESLLMFYWASLQSASEIPLTPCNTKMASRRLRESYFNSRICRLIEQVTATNDTAEMVPETSEDAEVDFKDRFRGALAVLESDLQTAGYRVNHRRDGKTTIHRRRDGVVIEMTLQVNLQSVAVRKRTLDQAGHAGRAVPSLEFEGIYTLPALSRALRGWLL